MMTREALIDKLLAYLNGAVSEQELVAWAENLCVAINAQDNNLPDEDALLDILAYIGAGDSHPGSMIDGRHNGGQSEQL